jgi:NAD(P)H-hydrate epimerase
MIPLLTAREMRQFEEESIQAWGIPSLVLQEHAARGALDLLPPGEPLHVLAGPGNNGGDALALARLARLQGRAVEVWTLSPEPAWKGDAAFQASLWAGLGGTFQSTRKPREALQRFRGWVVDGLFGLGTRLPLAGLAETWVTALADAVLEGKVPFKVLALDLPSGLDPSTTDVAGPAVQAHRTAVFGHLKVCHGLRPSSCFCGEIRLVPIPLRGAPECSLKVLERPGPLFGGRWDTHKRDFGHVAIRAGSEGMGGAAVLAALGALRMGAGLVTVLVDPEVRQEVASQVPEAMVRAWDGRVPGGVDVLLAGPGGVKDVPAWDGPLVLDASALAQGAGPAWMARPATVLTPHPGEFHRLFGGSRPLSHYTSERLERARAAAAGPGVLVLKGAQSIVAGGDLEEVWVNTTGHRGLSTGGSGDFLAGMVAARVGHWAKDGGRGAREEFRRLRQAVSDAVWLHGAAADAFGQGPILVRDLGPALAGLLRGIQEGSPDA